jgi:hypothetical protein
LRQVSATLESVSDTVASVNREFRDLQDTLNEGLDVLIGQPLLLARQIGDLIKAPSRALSGIESRLEAYALLAQSIFGSNAAKPAGALASGTSLRQRTTRVANDLHISDLFAMHAVAGSMASVTTTGAFDTRPSAIRAAVQVQQQYDDVVSWRDSGFAALATIPETSVSLLDPGQSVQALQRALAVTVGVLVQTSLGLKPERRIVLDRARTTVDLCAQLYQRVDDATLNLLSNSNKLTGDEELELPRGKSILYYPD